MQVLIGTTNKAKEERLKWLLTRIPADVLTLRETAGSDSSNLEEIGRTHKENACIKAKQLSEAHGLCTLASDGGLLIPILEGSWDSLTTHRFAGPAADDHERSRRLLELMRSYKGDDRKAQWVEAIAVAAEGKILACWQVQGPTGFLSEQLHSDTESTEGGFWVFDIWYFPELRKTYSQLNEDELVTINDHWTLLKDLLEQFFAGYAAGKIQQCSA